MHTAQQPSFVLNTGERYHSLYRCCWILPRGTTATLSVDSDHKHSLCSTSYTGKRDNVQREVGDEHHEGG